MIDYRYQPGWEQSITAAIAANESHSENGYSGSLALNIATKSPMSSHKINVSLIWMLIEKIINTFNADDSLHGLFSVLNKSDKRVSPFVATHDYRVHVVDCDANGNVKINISPIYRLGPEYPVMYEQKHGKKLEKEAVIKLFETTDPLVAFHPMGEKAFTLGIDAGMAFKDLKIPHNKELLLKLNVFDSGVTADLHCETQTMAKTYSWEQLDVQELVCAIPETDLVVAG